MGVQSNALRGNPRRRSLWSRPVARQEAINGYLFILPWLAGLCLLTLGPFLFGLYQSLCDFDAMTPARIIGLQNYIALARDWKFHLAVFNTAWYAFFSGVPNLIVGVLVAVVLNQKLQGIGVFRTLCYLPSVVPAVASVYLFMYLLHDQVGLINQVLGKVLNIRGPHWLASPQWTKPSMVLWSLWGFGGTMLTCLAGLQGIPEVLYEAAAIDGAGSARRFFGITIPMLSPTLFFMTVMGIIGSFQVFAPVFLMGSGAYAQAICGPMNSLLFWVIYIYNQAFFYFRMGYASAMAWILFVVLLVLTILQFRLAQRWVYYEGAR